MAKSRKHGGFCVAGVDESNGEWIRFVLNENRPLQDSDLICEDGSVIQVLDIVKVKLKKHFPKYYQPENYILDIDFSIEKLGRQTINNVLKIHPAENKTPLFYNYNKKVSPSEIEKIPYGERYSLILIKPRNVNIYERCEKLRCNFCYQGHCFSDIAITDPQFKVNAELENCLFVMSLGEFFEGYHYKLITQIFTI